ncbi:MAG: phosphoribosylglycinamide formyltransferase [Bacteroidia bacterium]|nr:phosphoribosylglycinamide formyltransferase [Bacteroidia bacterium]
MMSNSISLCRIAIFASGNGTNAQALIDRFATGDLAKIVLIASDNDHANVLNRAKNAGIPARVMDKGTRASGPALNALLQEYGVDLVVLAGYLKLIPAETAQKFAGRMVNIHPALLPAYGGKGMYGMRVHQAVIANQEKESGITVHLVNERYDEGGILEQARLTIAPDWTADKLAQEIHKLEHRVFPEVVERLCGEIKAGNR